MTIQNFYKKPRQGLFRKEVRLRTLNVAMLFFFVSSFTVFQVAAQERTVSGKVVSAKENTPLPGVNILIKGTNKGTVTDMSGGFTLLVDESDVLVISQVGMETLEITVGSQSTIDVSLNESTAVLSEVIVTALGISQEKRAIGYAAQEMKGDELLSTGQSNVVSSLQGRVAGVRIQTAGGAPGAGVSILVRGINSLSPNRSSEPLFVIDGVPISNETVSGSILPSSGSNSPGSNEQYAFSNRGADINPNDVESLTVLKGPAATALYGLRASNGVIIITTKKGKTGKPQISYSSSIGWDRINQTPEIQREYREGTSGVKRMGVPGAGTPFQTFGPKVTPYDPIYDNFKNFFQTGVRYNNSLSASGGNERSNYFASVSHLSQSGIVPNSEWKRTTFKISANSELSDKLNIRGSATYSHSGGLRAQGGDKSIMSALNYHTTSVDVNDYINPDGSIKSYAGTIIDNPRYLAEYSTLEDGVDRIIGYTGANYKILNWLNVDYQLGVDMYADERTRIAPNGLDISTSTGGFVVEERARYREVNSNFLLTATRDLTPDIKATFLIGNNILDINYNLLNARGEGLGLKEFYDLSNTANKFSFEDGYTRRLIGVFGDAKFDYKGIAYLNITGRNDWSSTLPVANRSFFYPSVNAGFVFTELLGLNNNNFFNYGKLRASWAQVGKDASAYLIGEYYQTAPNFPFNGVNGFRKSTTLGSDQLKSEKTTSLELGTELKFFTNRLWLDATYYRAISSDQIVEVPVSLVSGLSRYVTNAGEIRNQGVEILLGGLPFKKGDFKWEMSVNWSFNRSEVLSMPEGISEIIFTDDRIMNKIVVGGSIGDLYGRPYKRNANGEVLIDANGFPSWSDTFVKVGNALPDWMGGLVNTFTWKGLSLSFLIEVRKGGDAYDMGMRNRVRNGVDYRTTLRNVDVVFDGVTIADGSPNTIAVRLDGDTFYRNESRYNGVSDVLLQDASWVRLRNASLSYDLPRSILSKTFLTGLNLSVIGNNLFLATPFKGFDPEGSAYGSGSNSLGYTGLNIPATRSMTVSLTANF